MANYAQLEISSIRASAWLHDLETFLVGTGWRVANARASRPQDAHLLFFKNMQTGELKHKPIQDRYLVKIGHSFIGSMTAEEIKANYGAEVTSQLV
jgi:hypothetical protein